MPDLVVGTDGLPRCSWAVATEDYRAYHDDEWGRAVHGDGPLFERLALESFQSGLSWLTILRKREAFRAAFRGFDIEAVAEFDEFDVARLLADASIVRNRAKVRATIGNARAARALLAAEGSGALDHLVWSARHPGWERPVSFAGIPSSTPESTELANRFKLLGFTFLGPVTVFAGLCAVGVVDAHVAGCHRAGIDSSDPSGRGGGRIRR